MPDYEGLPRCSRLKVGGPAVDVAAGYSHSVVLRRDGSVIFFGDNDSGQLGVPGDFRDVPALVPLPGRCIGVAAGNSHTVALLEDGSVVSWGSGRNGQQGNASTDDVLLPAVLIGSCKNEGAVLA